MPASGSVVAVAGSMSWYAAACSGSGNQLVCSTTVDGQSESAPSPPTASVEASLDPPQAVRTRPADSRAAPGASSRERRQVRRAEGMTGLPHGSGGNRPATADRGAWRGERGSAPGRAVPGAGDQVGDPPEDPEDDQAEEGGEQDRAVQHLPVEVVAVDVDLQADARRPLAEEEVGDDRPDDG